MSCNLESEDLQEFSTIYASEYNKPELHDRILVFDVVAENEMLLAYKSIDEEGKGENSSTLKDPSDHQNIIGDDEKSKDDNIESVSAQSESTLTDNKETQTDIGDREFQFNTTENGINDSFIRQHKIFVHSSWLAVQSNYFRSLFFSGICYS